MANELTVDQRVKLEGIARDIKASSRRAAEEIINIGLALTEAKDILIGGFEDWVRDECRIEPRTARNFMAVARCFADRAETVSALPATILYNLASEKMSERVIDIVAQKAQNGELLSVLEAKTIIRDNRESQIREHTRAATNDVLQELAATGGYISVNGDSLKLEAAITERAAETYAAEAERQRSNLALTIQRQEEANGFRKLLERPGFYAAHDTKRGTLTVWVGKDLEVFNGMSYNHKLYLKIFDREKPEDSQP